MEIHQLRYFCAVVETSSFTQAAKRENVSQPSLSQQIIKLEIELGAQLFDRLHGRVRLTTAGEAFVEDARAILEHVAHAKQQVEESEGFEKGTVVCGISPNFSPDFLPARIAEFVRQHDQIEIRVVEDVTSVLLEYLRSRLIDMSLVVLPIGHAVAGEDLSMARLAREPLYAVLPAEHRMAEMTSIDLKELRGERFVFLKDGHCYSENIASVFRRSKLHPNVISESASPLHVVAMVCSGIGVSVVPEHAVDLRRKECRFIPISGDNSYSEMGLVHLKGNANNRAQLAFSKFLREYSESPGTQFQA